MPTLTSAPATPEGEPAAAPRSRSGRALSSCRAEINAQDKVIRELRQQIAEMEENHARYRIHTGNEYKAVFGAGLLMGVTPQATLADTAARMVVAAAKAQNSEHAANSALLQGGLIQLRHRIAHQIEVSKVKRQAASAEEELLDVHQGMLEVMEKTGRDFFAEARKILGRNFGPDFGPVPPRLHPSRDADLEALMKLQTIKAQAEAPRRPSVRFGFIRVREDGIAVSPADPAAPGATEGPAASQEQAKRPA